MAKPLLVFLCMGNSCRSQMAEGFARRLAGDGWDVTSAGIAPGAVHPRAVAAMAEVGIELSGHTAKPLDPAILKRASVIVTLCGDAEERCPLTPRHIRRVHWPLPDPARATGDDAVVMAVFRAVRDDIRQRVEDLLAAGGPLRPQ